METQMNEVQGNIAGVAGFRVAGVHAGLKADGALDMALIVSDRPCIAAGVFTTNLVKAAPVIVDMEKLRRNPEGIRAVLVNTRCANACTGEQGIANAYQMARWAAEALGFSEDEVLVMSTGVIGTQLPMDTIKHGIDLLVASLGDNWDAAARGIMTTDTKPKLASIDWENEEGGGGYTIAGIAKGAGMIAPNMATLLGIMVTDAALPDKRAADTLLRGVADTSFNRVVVDGDMSTNDTLLLLANGASGTKVEGGRNQVGFHFALSQAAEKLAKDIVRDGEGVTKFITLEILKAESNAAAKQIANTIATSALVKTAFYGGDPNWGRIIAAAGRAGIPLDPSKMTLHISNGQPEGDDYYGLLLFENGVPAAYDEQRASAIMSSTEIFVTLNCGQGSGQATVWTCDLSHDYVSINGHYRT
jgi:glutamate N-acetyltransferase/amino-acid N-acetyltransferase